jgi:hypothetical protein
MVINVGIVQMLCMLVVALLGLHKLTLVVESSFDATYRYTVQRACMLLTAFLPPRVSIYAACCCAQQSDFAKLDRDGRGEITKAAFVDAIIETVSTGTSSSDAVHLRTEHCCVASIESF